MTTTERPYALVAELTYRCPLRCVYCSNPTNYMDFADRLTTEDWLRVFKEAEQIGVLQVNLSGGEPLLRGDLIALVKGASEANLYSNLITSGIPLERDKLSALRDAGVNSVQVSIQDTNQAESDRIAGKTSFEKKLQSARWVKELGLPLTLNVVLHKNNIGHVAEIVELAETLEADRLELANTQYLAWALVNREQLLPTREQLTSARRCAVAAKGRLKGKMEVLFVLPDYYSDMPKACMSGWGRRYIVVSPDGLAMPCHLAHTIRGLAFDNVLNASLSEIWQNSAAFEAFRGSDWLPEPCRSCDKQSIDFGGCRCQAFHLTGDAGVTDPACSLSPDHSIVLLARTNATESLVPASLIYRSAARNART